MTFHIRKWKEESREDIAKLAKEYPFVAIATLEGLPANIQANLRKKLIKDAVIVVSKTKVVQKAFEQAGIDMSKMNNSVTENIAVIFSKKNPFELFSFVKKNKGDTSAKEGDIAEHDIIIQAGDTGLPPGPALTTLKSAGLKVTVQGPTISIVDDKLVTKKGEEVSKEVADVLGKLNMKPMKIGMKILGVLDKAEGQFYLASSLDVDEEELFNKFVLAYQQALNLSVEAEYFNEASTEVIVMKAAREAKAVKEALDSFMPQEAKVEETKADASEAPVEGAN